VYLVFHFSSIHVLPLIILWVMMLCVWSFNLTTLCFWSQCNRSVHCCRFLPSRSWLLVFKLIRFYLFGGYAKCAQSCMYV